MNVLDFIEYRMEKTAKLNTKLKDTLKGAGFDPRNPNKVLADTLKMEDLPNLTPQEFSRVKSHFHGRQAGDAIAQIRTTKYPKYKKLLQFKRKKMPKNEFFRFIVITPPRFIRLS